MSEVIWRIRAALLTVFLTLSAFASTAQANEGDLDTSFGYFHNGVSFLSSFRSYPKNDHAVAVLIRPDQSSVVVANINDSASGTGPPYFNSIAITRLEPGGLYDETFGNGGEFIIHGSASSGNDILATGAAMDVNGRIAISGYRNVNGTRSMAVWMLTSAGAIDVAGFSGGTLTISRGVSGAQDQALAIYAASTEDVIAGTLSDFLIAGSVQDPTQISVGAVVGIHGNGALYYDSTGNAAFASGPYTGARYTKTVISGPETTCNSELTSIAFRSTGIGVAQFYAAGNLNCPASGNQWAYVAHLDSQRMLDPFFNGGYTFFTFQPFPGPISSFASGVAVDPFNRPVAVGIVGDSSTLTTSMGAARLTTDAMFDTSFVGTGYKAIVWPGSDSSAATAVMIQRNGKILIGGRVNSGVNDFALARLNTDGSADTVYGGPQWSGIGRTYHFTIENHYADAGAAAMAFTYGERIALAGYTQDPRPGLTNNTYAGVMRIQGDLIMATGFGIYLDGRTPSP